MPMDRETTDAFERIADKLHARISEVAKEGREQSKEILEEVQTTRRETTAFGVELRAHKEFDESEFKRLDGDVKGLRDEIKAVDDKADGHAMGMARLGGATVTGGGLGAFLLELFRRSGGE